MQKKPRSLKFTATYEVRKVVAIIDKTSCAFNLFYFDNVGQRKKNPFVRFFEISLLMSELRDVSRASVKNSVPIFSEVFLLA